uniref:Phosphoglucosamine mutase n=1 Tax=Candidatus Aschnera chinzeii TaxID=1485666 RepID=A0AAT9G581_9ENTR|nr:MAG: phosphoglucosamine mutase [Candidatus Aschnera chinzeii]
MNKRKYFGTDGIRGRVGVTPMTPDFILKLGWAIGKTLGCNGSRKIIIGKDTRISGCMLEDSLKAGIVASGTSVALTNNMPTPGIAYLTRIHHAEAGIVISASHNPYYDNGIKFFSINGTKLSNEIEKKIEIEMQKPLTCVKSIKLGTTSQLINAERKYIDYCKSTFPANQSLSDFKIVLDCANGATYHIAPNIMLELGAKVIVIGCQPNGFNINHNCGTINIKTLQKKVIKEKADIGIAFDGDGDRVIIVDHLGNKIDGDQILYIIARDAFINNQLHGGVVGTIMSNMGLEKALHNLGIPFIRTTVGDRYVLQKMQEYGWMFGAENSGHIILLNKTTTCDGIIAGLQVLSAMIRNNMSTYDLCRDIKLFPQILKNVYFSGNNNPLTKKNVLNVVNKIKTKLANKGRVLLRKSGTEPVIRIMVEGENKKQITNMVNNIIDAVKYAK